MQSHLLDRLEGDLAAYIQQRNRFARIFKEKEFSILNLTASDRKELLDRLEGDLSPENLCCDGELRGAPLRAKAAMLNGAKAALDYLGGGSTYK